MAIINKHNLKKKSISLDSENKEMVYMLCSVFQTTYKSHCHSAVW